MQPVEQLQSEIATLPPDLAAEVLDFVLFVKHRHTPAAKYKRPEPTQAADEGEALSLFQALDAIGFIGCIESDEQLSTTYKQKLDFSHKCGEGQ